jgi:hypothetical protein
VDSLLSGARAEKIQASHLNLAAQALPAVYPQDM